jgi:ABC-type phosphate/phosphonate transport system substrate-binding protein
MTSCWLTETAYGSSLHQPTRSLGADTGSTAACSGAPRGTDRAHGELRGFRCVVNTPTSHSGMNVLRALFASMHQKGRFFSAVLHSGSHEASLRMIADGFADVASIDRVTYALIERYRPLALRTTRVLCCSVRTPAPPYVTGSQMTDTQVEQIRYPLMETLAMPSMKVAMEALLLDGLANLPVETYRPIGDLERWAHQMGYHEIDDGSQKHENCGCAVVS